MLSGSAWVSFLGMVISVLLITCLAYLFTRYVVGTKQGMLIGMQNKKENMQVIQQLYLGKGQRVVVVQAGKRYMVLGVTENNITMLTEMSEEEVLPWLQEKAETKPEFKKSLIEVLKKEKAGVKNSGGKLD